MPVLLTGGTVYVRTNETCGIILGTGEVYWIEFSEQPQFKSFGLNPGVFLWIYHVKETRKIQSIVLGKDVPNKADLPAADPVDVEDRPPFERSDYSP